MAANLTPSEYRDNLVNAQEFKGRFTFPTQKINIEGSINNSPGRAEYQLIIGNDADFQIHGITGTYRYLYSSTAARIFTSNAVNELTIANGNLNNSSYFGSNPDSAGLVPSMIQRLNNYLASPTPNDNFLIDLANVLESILVWYGTSSAIPQTAAFSINLVLRQLGEMPWSEFGLPHPVSEDGEDDLHVRIIDGKSNRTLTEGFVPLELILSPGAYGNPLRLILPFSHIVQRNSYLRLEFVNHTPSHAIVEMAFQGTKFYV